MGAARVDRYWEQYCRDGQVTVRASVVKGVLGMIATILLAVVCAGMSVEAFLTDGAGSVKGWGCAFFTPVILCGAVFTVYPVVRQRRLDLMPWGFFMSRRRRGQRITELALRWTDVDHVKAFRTTGSGDGGDSTDIRIVLAPGVRAVYGGEEKEGFVELPSGFRMSKKNLASLMERIRVSRV